MTVATVDISTIDAMPSSARPSGSVSGQQPPDAPIGDPGRIPIMLTGLRARLDACRPTNIGFPSTLDLDLTPLLPFFNQLLNNVGDPDQAAVFPAHAKDLEREVVGILGDLFRAPEDDRWGYVTTGGSEGVEYGLLLARTLYPDAVTYASTSAHWCVPKITSKLRMPTVTVRALPDGRMDLRDLSVVLGQHRHLPAVIVANIGTTMTEAVDDVAEIRRILAEAPISRAFVHADAALSGLALALLPPEPRIGFDLADGADCISVSGHKFLGSPMPCGAVITRRSLKTRLGGSVELLGTHDSTVGGSRSGHAPLVLWYALHCYGLDGLRDRVRYARDLADYTVGQLGRIGWRAWRHPHAMTVVLDPPPPSIAVRWAIPISGGDAHLITMPSTTAVQIGVFVAELAGLPSGLEFDSLSSGVEGTAANSVVANDV